MSALIGGNLSITRLPVVSDLYYYTATVEDVHLTHKAWPRGGYKHRELTNQNRNLTWFLALYIFKQKCDTFAPSFA